MRISPDSRAMYQRYASTDIRRGDDRLVRLPSKTLRECGHPGTAAQCHRTKSLRDSWEVRLVLSH
jgi:hypothetical protein